MLLRPIDWPDYRTFRSPLARDLCWLLSPDFDLPMPASSYRAFSAVANQNVVEWLRLLDEEARADQPLSAQWGRLGHYFEDLVAYYLTHSPSSGISTLRRNLPLRKTLAKGKGIETVGELDFLLEQDGQLQHLEVAVKFYLGMGEEPLRQWVGPNSKDRLDIKWRRMIHHQLPLAQRFSEYEGIDSRYWLKGILFQPWRDLAVDGQPQFDWLHISDAEEYFGRYDGHWQWLQKCHWLGAFSEGQLTLRTQPLLLQLRRHFAQAGHGVMLVNRSVAAQHRCFVVADDWPATHPPGLSAQQD